MPVPDGRAVKTRWGDICAKRPNWLAALVLPRDGVARGGKGGEGWRPGYVYVIWVDTRLSVTHTVDVDERRERISRRVYTCCCCCEYSPYGFTGYTHVKPYGVHFVMCKQPYLWSALYPALGGVWPARCVNWHYCKQRRRHARGRGTENEKEARNKS